MASRSRAAASSLKRLSGHGSAGVLCGRARASVTALFGDKPQAPAAAAIELSKKVLRRIVMASVPLCPTQPFLIWIIEANPDISLQRWESRVRLQPWG